VKKFLNSYSSPYSKTKQTKYLNIFLAQYLILLDLAAFGLPLGQAIGRLGNWFNQELYGRPTNLPWGIYIRPENRLSGYEQFSHFHPLFLYESLWCLGIFIFLYLLTNNFHKARTRKFKQFFQTHASSLGTINSNEVKKFLNLYSSPLKYCPGLLFFTYLFLYSFGRFWLEYLRINPWQWGGLAVAQWFCIAAFVSSIVGLALYIKNR